MFGDGSLGVQRPGRIEMNPRKHKSNSRKEIR